MTATFAMPALGADMEAGTLNRWRKGPGDAVRHGDIVAEVETDKGVIDVECYADGVIESLLVEPGAHVPVGTPLATIREAAEPGPKPDHKAAPSPPVAVEVVPIPRELQPLLISPTASRLARARGIDPATIHGTGVHGRVLRRDVEAALATPIAPGPARERPVEPSPHPAPSAPPGRGRATPRAREMAAALGVDLSSLTGTGPGGWIMHGDIEAAGNRPEPPEDPRVRMRRAIAAAMSRSNSEIPHYHLTTTIDLERATHWLVAENERRDVTDRLLLAVVLVKAVAVALHETPSLNAVWKDQQVVRSDAVHAGVAISLRGGGLVAPALHDADTRNLDEVMHAFGDLVKRARQGGLRSSDSPTPP